MKTMKKLVSLIMALAMVMALAVSASAEGPSITINNSGKNETYKVYKLFNATYNETTETVAYTVIDGIGIPDTLKDYFALDPNTGAVSYKGTGDTFAYDSALATALKTWAEGATPVDADGVKGVGGSLKIDLDSYGYYVVTSTVGGGSAVSVTSVSPAATINDKNDYDIPTVENGDKKANVTSSDNGQDVNYTIEFQTVNYVDQVTTNGAPAQQVEKYIITDDLANGKLSAKEDTITVQVGTSPLVKGTDYTYAGGIFTVNWMKDGKSLYDNGATITIKYTATVTSESGAEAITNKFKVEYKLVGVDDPGKVPTEPEVTVYTSKITVNKVDENNAPLAGADFALTNSEGKYYHNDGGVVTWVVDQPAVSDDETKTSFEFTGLKDGTYTLVEIRTPDGYNTVDPADEKLTVVVKAADTEHNVAYSTSITNHAGLELPETGGIGTTIFTVAGSVMMIGAAILYITKKRSEDCAN